MTETPTTPDVPTVARPASVATSAQVQAEAQARSSVAVADAAENARKPGPSTSEFKFSVASLVFAALLGALKVLAVIPGPWQLPAAIGAGAIASAAVYSNSRGKIKAAALAAAAVSDSGSHVLPNE